MRTLRGAVAPVLLAFLALLLLAAPRPAAALDPARIDTLEIQTESGRYSFRTEIADTPELRERGLMFRHIIPQDRAMLFNWGDVSPVSMWMRNTHVALDMIFIGKTGRVVNIATDAVPLSETIIRSAGPVAAVLEVAAGTAKRIGLKPGDKVIHPSFDPEP